MFLYVHHVHYICRDLAEMMKYLEDNFGLKPNDVIEHRNLKEALYDIDKTQIQLTEPLDPKSDMAQQLAKDGPGVWHVAWGVNDIRKVAKDLMAKGNKLRNADGITNSPLGYLTINIDRDSSKGMFLQLAEGKRQLKK
jgi:methylmalonyl-CoA/ethylmalonyl-CoA epimerase